VTESELRERVDELIGRIRDLVEAREGSFEVGERYDFLWTGTARLPDAKVLFSALKTGTRFPPDGSKMGYKASAELTAGNRKLAELFLYPNGWRIEFPGGPCLPLDNFAISRALDAAKE
jgi:hypothetical protein